MQNNNHQPAVPVCLSLGILAWNEEATLRGTLESLFAQSLFARLQARNECCEIICVPNGCTDRTAALARSLFARFAREHPHAAAWTSRVIEIPVPGKNNAWNRFVHDFSSPDARYLGLMDSDILFHHPDTLANLVETLDQQHHAWVACDQQIKEIAFKPRKTVRDRLSLATSNMTGTIEGRLAGHLYCMRTHVARHLYLPHALGALEDGFFKTIICTDFLTHEPDPGRVVTAPNASHLYEAYQSVVDVLKNQKRQMMGQATVHVLIEYLKTLPLDQRVNLAETLREFDRTDPDWLRRLLDLHLKRTHVFWRLFPGLLTFRFRRLWSLGGTRRWTHLPAALAGFVVTLVASQRAYHTLRKGQTHFWPKASRGPFLNLLQPETK